MDCKEWATKCTDALRKYPAHILCTNPIYISIVITCIIMLIVTYTYDDTHRVKTGFWIFVTVILGVFLNNQFMIKDYRNIMMTETDRSLHDILSKGERVHETFANNEFNSTIDSPIISDI